MAEGFRSTQNTTQTEPRQIRTIPNGHSTDSPKLSRARSRLPQTPLRFAKSRLAAVARLHSACGRLSQAYGLPAPLTGEPGEKPPLQGEEGRAQAWRRGSAVRRTPPKQNQGKFVQSQTDILRIRPSSQEPVAVYRKPLCDSLRAAWRRLLACIAPAGA